jgi:mannose-6-phosphate isomerase-like protein (cupin superfamily)
MASFIVAPPLSGKVLGSAANSFVVAEWRDSGGPVSDIPQLIAPLHLHRSDDEAWYVLEGVLRVRRGNEIVEVRSGSSVLVPRGTPHTYWNPTPEPARYLLVMTANIFQLIEAIHALQDRNPSTLRALFKKYNSELLNQ